MTTAEMTLEEIRTAGLEALERELGTVGMVRFLQLFRPGRGDYTEERHQWLDGTDLETIAEHIRQRRTAGDRALPDGEAVREGSVPGEPSRGSFLRVAEDTLVQGRRHAEPDGPEGIEMRAESADLAASLPA